MTRSTLSEIAYAETLEQKLHFAWKYCQEIGVEYSPIDSYSRKPAAAAEMIWAHGRYGKRAAAIKKLDAIHIVCTFLTYKAGEA